MVLRVSAYGMRVCWDLDIKRPEILRFPAFKALGAEILGAEIELRQTRINIR